MGFALTMPALTIMMTMPSFVWINWRAHTEQ